MKPETWRQLGLKDDEYQMILEILGRKPNYVELSMYSVMWSEHCSYKHSKRVLKMFPTENDRTLLGPGENAGIVDIGDGLAVAFKIESHNHPSAIEPYQGAATGVGGIIRDIFTMGARPVALLNSLRFGPLEEDRVRWLFSGVVSGIAGYGNCIGIPTVGGEVFFDDSYEGNPLVNAMCVGIMDHEKISLGRAKGEGNSVILVGARTGRDGIHGVTFASEELGEESGERRPAVQVGDPFMEKLLVEACLELIEMGVVVGIQDLGGAGLTCATSEMSSRGGTGMDIDISHVPLREEGMDPFEIMISESQERMLLVVEKEKEETVKEVFEKWELTASVIGKVTGDGMVRVRDKALVVAEVPARSLAEEAPLYCPEMKFPSYLEEVSPLSIEDIPEPQEAEEVFLRLITSPNIASKEWVYRQYDHMVRTCTVILPGSDAAILRIRGTDKGIAMTTDGNGRYVYLDPYLGGMIAVAEAARNLSCSGADPLAVTDCLNFGNPEKPEVYWQFYKTVEGMSQACREFNTPVIGGNVSFYNETTKGAIFPTPVVGMVGLLENIEQRCNAAYKKEGDIIFLAGGGEPTAGGSEYLKHIHGLLKGSPPELDFQREKKLQSFLREAIKAGLLSSAHDLSEGGLGVALAEGCFLGNLGIEVKLSMGLNLRWDIFLFGEVQSQALVTVDPKVQEEVTRLAGKKGVPLKEIGFVGGKNYKVEIRSAGMNRTINLPLEEIKSKWRGAIECMMEL
ncbi:MAG: phosphoribosylformylglycinamidine synthase subunit PurL [Candidatus Syntrophonatronum acetioxidans]|uniref:Phosphoribosylformylglycinamidine synthase subunit PurL n=1 Tax=Candidatus Syntrophonatronum acetioxidans TaxID=1795816 RepID=A0A424YCZ7_9FIRM|nr:MAG: phosphoribosylformylglycinamidine synthase subunit PurL [Candidatus Syntrophonatronum acetioxidans]